MYSAAINRETAQRRVDRMNNPEGYSNDEKCYTVAMARADSKKKREEEKKKKADAARIKREAKKKNV